ncbi:hypothetical protein, partial [Pseudovibrio ascidiaceicola]|uniref:hypothetical protein n=1 Tax=Pseudovibrio ascidiaceicola TaxID=285279 RepID=UPI001AD8F085
NTVIAPQSTEQDADLVLSGIALTGLAPNGLNRLLSCSAGSPRVLPIVHSCRRDLRPKHSLIQTHPSAHMASTGNNFH